MAGPYYVNSAAAGANNGSSWTDAYTTFAAAVTAATTAADIIYVASVHNESLAADVTYTFGASNIKVICCTSGTTTPTTGAVIGSQATARFIQFAAASRTVYVYGITLKVPGTGASSIYIGTAVDGGDITLESCRLELNTTSASAFFYIGSYNSATNDNYSVTLKDTVIKFGATGQNLVPAKSKIRLQNVTVDAAGTAPTTLFGVGGIAATSFLFVEGCDLSKVTGTLIGDFSTAYVNAYFINCKFGSGVTPRAASTSVNMAGGEVWVNNCASGDTHYHMQHYNALGQTTISTAIYITADGASYDGTNRCSWVIATTANATYYNPYVSPWFDRYNAATSAVTPRIEILRDGSATAYKDDEVWGEWSVQSTSGAPLAVFVNDRMALLGSSANQATSSLAGGDWTGEGGTAWFGKLEPGSTVTPAEIGHFRARVCVGAASITVYADPRIRGV